MIVELIQDSWLQKRPMACYLNKLPVGYLDGRRVDVAECRRVEYCAFSVRKEVVLTNIRESLALRDG